MFHCSTGTLQGHSRSRSISNRLRPTNKLWQRWRSQRRPWRRVIPSIASSNYVYDLYCVYLWIYLYCKLFIFHNCIWLLHWRQTSLAFWHYEKTGMTSLYQVVKVWWFDTSYISVTDVRTNGLGRHALQEHCMLEGNGQMKLVSVHGARIKVRARVSSNR